MTMRKNFVPGAVFARARLRMIIPAIAFAVLAACSSPEERIAKLYASGQEFLEAGELGKANVQFQNALKIDESHVPTLIGLSKIAESKQDFRGMFALLQRIVRLESENLDAIVNLGKLYLIGSDETAAMEYADKALALDPDDVGALGLKAAVLLKVSDNAGAVAMARKALAIDPASPEAVTVLATERTLADKPEEAIAILERALAVDEKVAILQLLRIRILSSMDRTEDVAAAYENLIKVFPDEPAYRRVYASELIRRNDFAKALAQIESLAELQPDSLDAKLDVIRVLKKLEGADAARVRLQAYVDAEPGRDDLKFALGEYYRQEGDSETARKIYSPLTKSKDTDVAMRAKNHLVTLHLLDKNLDGARKLLEEILAKDEGNTDALIKRAGLLIDAQEYDAAIRDLRTALDNNPDAAGPMILMASAFERKGDLALAESQLARAVEASDANAKTAKIFAKFLMRQKNIGRAEEVLVNSLAAQPGDLDNLKFLAAIRLANQDWRGAQEIAGIIDDIDKSGGTADDIRTIAYSGLKDYDRIIESLSERSERAPLKSRPLATLIAAYLRTDRPDEAESMLRRIIENQDGAYVERILLAQVLGTQQRNDEAEVVLLAAVEEDLGRSEAFELLYRYYIRIGERAKAERFIDDGLARAPDNQALRVFKADVLLTNGKMEEAFGLYEVLVNERPNDKIIVNNYVSLANDLRQGPANKGRVLKAAKVLEGEDNPYFKDTLGWAYYRAGDVSAALPLLKEAAAGNDSHPEILYHLGAAFLANSDKENARINLEKALDVGGAEFRFKEDVKELLEQV